MLRLPEVLISEQIKTDVPGQESEGDLSGSAMLKKPVTGRVKGSRLSRKNYFCLLISTSVPERGSLSRLPGQV